MQRDVYASLFKVPRQRTIAIDILQLNGHCARERVYEEVFRGYSERRLMLMTDMAGKDARVTHDVVVPSFAKLRAIHAPGFRYKLLTHLCTDAETFIGLQAICASPCSPFRIEDRRFAQLLTCRFSRLSPHRRQVCDFLSRYGPPAGPDHPTASRKLIIDRVEFDGVLMTQSKFTQLADAAAATTQAGVVMPGRATTTSFVSAAALVTTHEVLTEKLITERAAMRDFYESPLYVQCSGRCALSVALRYIEHRMHFMLVKTPVGADHAGRRHALLDLARERRLFVYEKVAEDTYCYAV